MVCVLRLELPVRAAQLWLRNRAAGERRKQEEEAPVSSTGTAGMQAGIHPPEKRPFWVEESSPRVLPEHLKL